MDLLLIVKINYGFTTKEAKAYIKTLSDKQKECLIEGANNTAKKSFYND